MCPTSTSFRRCRRCPATRPSITGTTRQRRTPTSRTTSMSGSCPRKRPGRLDLREVVTVPEYFLVPLQSIPRSIDDITQVSEGFGADPVLVGCTAPTSTRPHTRLIPGRVGSSAGGPDPPRSYGESLQPDAVTLVFADATQPGAVVGFGALTADGSTRWGPPVPVPAGATTVTGRHRPALRSGSRSSCWRASFLPSVRSSPWPRTSLRVGCVVVCAPSGTVAAGRPLAGLRGVSTPPRKPPEPIVASTAGGRRLPVHVLSSTTKSEQIRLDVLLPADDTAVRSVAWDSGWSATVSVNGGIGRSVPVNNFHLVQQVHIPAGDDVVTFHYRPQAPALGQPPKAWALFSWRRAAWWCVGAAP